VSAGTIHRYPWDDLRRFAAALGGAVGLVPARALTLASHLLWFDAAGVARWGIATLPDWLEAMVGGHVDVQALGQVQSERSALVMFDGQNGIAPLLLERAAELAVEKARETALGLVRVTRVAAVPSVAAVTAGIALGPMAGVVVGPNQLWGMGLPSGTGLPLVIDSALAGAPEAGKLATRPPHHDASQPGTSRRDPSALLETLGIATDVLLPDQGWLVAAVSVPALEPLTTFHARVAAALSERTEAPGRLLPQTWDAHRRAARAQGVPLAAPAWKSLADWARRLAVDLPRPVSAGS
jgi:LDH2 family malate/lactate/ureidoglycolate dehydrogenase